MLNATAVPTTGKSHLGKAFAAGEGRVAAGAAQLGGGGVLTPGCGGETLNRSLEAGTACSGNCWEIIWFAAAVPSAPQTGQRTAQLICPFTGSASKEYFWPQPHRILMGMVV